MAIKNGLTFWNRPGTIDSDCCGEICVILINLSDKEFILNEGKRICQMVIVAHETVEWEDVDVLAETDRGSGGFGHTGKE